MPTLLNPYLSFKGNAREALAFYQSVFGGELSISTFGEFQPPADGSRAEGMAPSEAEKVMHGMLITPKGLVLMGSDTPEGMPHAHGSSISISLSGEDEEEMRGYWDRLAEGGSVSVPLDRAPWGDCFGMLTDRFGTAWLVNVNSPQQGGEPRETS
jgi:PhnB protein